MIKHPTGEVIRNDGCISKDDPWFLLTDKNVLGIKSKGSNDKAINERENMYSL